MKFEAENVAETKSDFNYNFVLFADVQGMQLKKRATEFMLILNLKWRMDDYYGNFNETTYEANRVDVLF